MDAMCSYKYPSHLEGKMHAFKLCSLEASISTHYIMTPFLLFVFVFASQVIGGFNTKLPSPAYGNIISILSIDGGGIKGIIPTVVLGNLENALKVNDLLINIKIKLIFLLTKLMFLIESKQTLHFE